ncbi:hypothetical protein [Profundibacter sp.]|uniref:hypothetical protein n=1 Tax=Profundibacter sp. TaxID=3101071 RepID=UPI003D1200C2
MRKYKLNYGQTQPAVIRGLALTVFALSGCVSPQPASAPLPQRIIPYSGGLKIADSGGLEISFGRTQEGVEKAIDRLVGPRIIDGVDDGAGCELRSWSGTGLSLIFDKGAFVGWIAGPPTWPAPKRSAGNTCGWG